MRIGFDAKKIACNLTGIGNYSRGVVNALSAYYPHNSYILFTPKKGKKEPLSRLHLTENVSFHYPSASLPRFLVEWWRCRGVVKDIAGNDVDIFHGLSNEIPFGIKRACKSVVTIHDLIFLRYPQTYSFLQRQILKVKTKYACRHADRIIAISQKTKDDIIHFYHIPEEKIDIVYQGCDSLFYHPVSEHDIKNVREKYGLHNPYILSVGTFQPRKNQRSVIKALAGCNQALDAVLVGKDTPYKTELEKEINDCHLKDRVHILSNFPNKDLPALYKGSLCFLYLSYFEGFGIPVLEALVSGTPVIAAEGSCLEEAGGPDSLYCDPHDIPALIRQINSVSAFSPEERENIIQQGRKYAEQFSEESIAKNVMSVYMRTLQNDNTSL